MNISRVHNSPYVHYPKPKDLDALVDESNRDDIKTISAEQEKTLIEQEEDNESSPEYRQKIEELKSIEREVIAHEMAHKSVGGQYASSASFTYSMGPDGKRYKTGGEVSINVPTGGDLEKTEVALERVKRAALAPAKPSGQDLRVAASAAASQQQIRAEITRQKAKEAYVKNTKNAKASIIQEKGQFNIAI